MNETMFNMFNGGQSSIDEKGVPIWPIEKESILKIKHR